MPRAWVVATLLLGACTEAPVGTAPEAPAAAPPADTKPAEAPPVVLDAQVAALVSAGATCPLTHRGAIETDCPAREAVVAYVRTNDNSADIATTCGGLLRDTNLAVRLTAAACLARLTTHAVTPQLGAVLDAMERETNPAALQQLAYAADSADAITSKRDTRVVALIDRLAATPEGEDAASNLLHALFPGSVLGGDVTPTPLAVATVLAAVARPSGSLLQSSFEMVKHVPDKAVACAALGKAIHEDAPEWNHALGAMADIGAPCAAEAPHAAEVAFTILATHDDSLQAILFLDQQIELPPELRAKGAAALRAGAKAAPTWKKADFTKAAAQFERPRRPTPP